ncbi:hypothetical protein V8F33_004837 [Rhypophila sp. PSN 637]
MSRPREHTRDGHERLEREHLFSPGAVGDRRYISLLNRERAGDKHERPESEATRKAPGIYAIDDSDDEDDLPPSKKHRKDQEILDKREEIHELEGVILARDREILRLKQTIHDLRVKLRMKDDALKRKDSKLRTPEMNNDGDVKRENMVLHGDLEFFQAAKEKSELRVSELEAQINACKEKVAQLNVRWDDLTYVETKEISVEELENSIEEFDRKDLVHSSLCALIDILGGLEKPKGEAVDRRDKDVISVDEDSGDDV